MNCDICKAPDSIAVKQIRPFGNPNYHLLDICKECYDTNAIYKGI